MANSDEIVEQIRERADIVEVIGGYVELRKQGRDFSGLCPFHREKSPSFSVSPSKKFFYCFGCHEKGDVFSFIMRHEGLDFPGAIRKLGEQVGVEVAPESPQERERRAEREELLKANRVAHTFFMKQLSGAGAARAQRYLGERGINAPFAREQRLGFGGESGAFFKYLAEQGVEKAVAMKAGLVTDSQERCLFDSKIIFPIFSDGQLVGFGGRRIGDGHGPKYVNSRESALFQKSGLLYGWDAAADSLRRSKRAILVEGYTDVLACHRAGVTEAMAALGTAFTHDHVKRIARLAKTVVLLLDADAAGLRASRGAAIKILEAKLKVRVARLPSGEDPDSLLRRSGPGALTQAIEEGVPAVDYFMEAAFADKAMSIEERSEAAASLAPLLKAVSSGLERDLYTAQLAERVGVTIEQLQRHLEAQAHQKKPKKKPQKPPMSAPRPRPTPEPDFSSPRFSVDEGEQEFGGSFQMPPENRELEEAPPVEEAPRLPDKRELDALRELLLYPELRPRFEELAEFAISDVMKELLDDLSEGEKSLSEVLRKHLPQPRVSDLLVVEPAELEEGADREFMAQRTFEDVCLKFKVYHLKEQRDAVLSEVKEVEGAGGDTTSLVAKKLKLAKMVRELEQRR